MVDESISDEELDAVFRRMVDLFIDRANELAENNSPENVSMAILYAASRFNAHVVSQHAHSLDDYERDLAQAKSFFLDQYQQMLTENLEDYKQVYQKYSQFIKKQ